MNDLNLISGERIKFILDQIDLISVPSCKQKEFQQSQKFPESFYLILQVGTQAQIIQHMKELQTLIFRLHRQGKSYQIIIDFVLHHIPWTNSKLFIDNWIHFDGYIHNLLLVNKPMLNVIYQLLLSFAKKGNKQYINEIYGKIMGSIVRLWRQYPMYRDRLITAISEQYPYKGCPLQIHKQYLILLLQLILKIPKLIGPIFDILLQKLIQIDTEINLETKNPLSDQKQLKRNADNINKINQLLCILFQFFNKIYRKDFTPFYGLIPDIPQQQLRIFFSIDLLLIFENKILNVHKSRFIQFIYFYLAYLHQQNCQNFLSLLIRKSCSNRIPNQQIRNSIFYLESFLVKSNFCSIRVIVKTLEQIIKNLETNLKFEKDIKKLEDQRVGELMKKFQIYYYQLQLILFICIYKWQVIKQISSSLLKLFQLCQNKIFGFFFIKQNIINQFILNLQQINNQKNINQIINFMKINDIINKQQQDILTKHYLEIFNVFDINLLKQSKKYFDNIFNYVEVQKLKRKNSSIHLPSDEQIVKRKNSNIKIQIPYKKLHIQKESLEESQESTNGIISL